MFEKRNEFDLTCNSGYRLSDVAPPAEVLLWPALVHCVVVGHVKHDYRLQEG